MKIEDLIIFTIYSLPEKKLKFEDILNNCFKIFPDVVVFKDYPQWPDSRKIEWALERLRSKKNIAGGRRPGFFLTKKGEISAKEIARTLKQEKLKI